MFSPPLTVATDGYAMPFLTHADFSGTERVSLFTRDMADQASV